MTTPNPQNNPVQDPGSSNTPQPSPNNPQQGFSNDQQASPSDSPQIYPGNHPAPYQGSQQQGYAPNNGQNGYAQMMGYSAPMQTKPYQGRSWAVALLLSFFLGGFGAHNFYLDRKGAAITQLVFTVLGVLTSAIILGFFILAVVGLWVFVDFIGILLNRQKFD